MRQFKIFVRNKTFNPFDNSKNNFKDYVIEKLSENILSAFTEFINKIKITNDDPYSNKVPYYPLPPYSEIEIIILDETNHIEMKHDIKTKDITNPKIIS